MIDANETFGGTWPFGPRYFEGNGFRMHYVDEGKGDPIVCLHGTPSWGYLYRRFIPPLSRTHRVIVPDHMGLGKSATPRDRDYSLQAHIDNLTGLIEALDLKNITFVIQDWGGFIGSAYAVQNPERVKRLFLLNTLSGYGRAQPEVTPWFKFVKKHHDANTLHEILGNLDANILSVMKMIGFENVAAVDSNWIAAYRSPFPTKEDCIAATELMYDALLGRAAPVVQASYARVDNLKSKPAMLTVGMQDKGISPDWQIADFEAVWPGRPIIKLPDAGHFSQEDEPNTIIALIQQFIQTT